MAALHLDSDQANNYMKIYRIIRGILESQSLKSVDLSGQH